MTGSGVKKLFVIFEWTFYRNTVDVGVSPWESKHGE